MAYDKNMDYIASTQTLVGEQPKRLMDLDTGEVFNATQVTKRTYGTKNFWKCYLMDFLTVLGILDSKQVDIFVYIVENTNQTTNQFIGTYKKIAKDVGVSEPTIARIMKKLQAENFIKKVQNGVWFINPDVLMRGNDGKRKMLLSYYESDEPINQITKSKVKAREKKNSEQEQTSNNATQTSTSPTPQDTSVESEKDRLIQQARQTNLVEYLQSKGEQLKRVGNNYQHGEHDSLYIKDNMFQWFSQNKNGNSIDFLMLYYGMTFNQAVEELTGQAIKRKIGTEKRKEHTDSSVNHSYQAPTKANEEKRVLAYLCKTRHISSDVIYPLIKNGLLFQDKEHGNCNFVIHDWEGNTVGAEIHGTGTKRYKQTTTHEYPFHFSLGDSKPKSILYFESAIDLLSCYQLKKSDLEKVSCMLVSMGGKMPNIVRNLFERFPEAAHIMCVDNDEAGTDFIEGLKTEMPIYDRRPPTEFKDWNEYLQSDEER